MKKVLKKIGLAILILLVGFVIIKWNKIVESYHYAQHRKPENRLHYFQDFQNYVNTRTIEKSSKPSKLKVSDTLMMLPENFLTQDSLANTEHYLDFLRYEGLLVLKDGKIVYENYWNGLTEDKTHLAYSITKSIMSITIGIAIRDELIDSKDDLVIKYLPQFKKTWYKNVTIDDCLDMVSGVKWENDNPMMMKFMWKWGWDLTTAEEFLMEREAWHSPGEQMIYNSMDPLMIGLILKSVIGERTISEYIHEKLWEPLGAENNAYFTNINTNDIEVTWMGINASLKDLAKVGQLYLQEGEWNGKQIVSKSWINQSYTAHRETTKPQVNNSLRFEYDTYGWGYNNYWWIPDDTNGDEIFAWGSVGQTIYINRQKNVVVVSFRANPLNLGGQSPNFLDRSMVDFMQAIGNSME